MLRLSWTYVSVICYIVSNLIAGMKTRISLSGQPAIQSGRSTDSDGSQFPTGHFGLVFFLPLCYLLIEHNNFPLRGTIWYLFDRFWQVPGFANFRNEKFCNSASSLTYICMFSFSLWTLHVLKSQCLSIFGHCSPENQSTEYV